MPTSLATVLLILFAIWYASHSQPTLPEIMLRTISLGPELILNPSFDTGDFTSWSGSGTSPCPSPRITCSITPWTASDDSHQLEVILNGTAGDTNFFQIEQVVPVDPDSTYFLSAAMRTLDRTSTSKLAYILYQDVTKTPIDCIGSYCHHFSGASAGPGSTPWARYGSETVQFSDDAHFVGIRPRSTDTSGFGTTWFDDFSLRKIVSSEISSFDSASVVVLSSPDNSFGVVLDRFSGSFLWIGFWGSDLDSVESNRLVSESNWTLPVLYELTTKVGVFGSGQTVGNWVSDGIVWELEERMSARARFSHLALGVDVVVSFTLVSDSNSIEIRAFVENGNPELIVQSLTTPILNLRSHLDKFLHSYHTGNLYSDIPNMDASDTYYIYSHPGSMATQFMAYFDEVTPVALYMQTTDTVGHYKEMGFERIRDASRDLLRVSFTHFQNEIAGTDLVPMEDYAVVLRLMKPVGGVGGSRTTWRWEDFAEEYRNWAVDSFGFLPVWERDDVPQLVFELNAIHTTFSLPPEHYVWNAREYKRLFESEPYAFTDYQHAIMPGGYWGRPEQTIMEDGYPMRTRWCGPDYFFPYETMETSIDPVGVGMGDVLVDALSELPSEGTQLYLWLSGNKWDIWEKNASGTLVYNDTEHFLLANGPDYVLIKEDGSPYYVDNRFTSNQRHSALLDLEGMTKVIVEPFVAGMRRGVAFMSIDQIVGGWTYFNWDARYSDRIGFSQGTHARFVQLLEELNGRIAEEGKRGEFGFSLEETNELYIPYLQLHMVRQARESSFSVRGIENSSSSNIPIFSYVYSQNAIGMDEYETVYQGASSLSSSKAWSIARTVLQANVPGILTCNDYDRRDRCQLGAYNLIVQQSFHFYKKMMTAVGIDFRGARRLPPLFVGGLPPDLSVPDDSKRSFFINFVFPAVELSYLMKKSGDIHYVFVNLLDESTDVSLTVEVGRYHLVHVEAFEVRLTRNANSSASLVVSSSTPLGSSLMIDFSFSYLDVVAIEQTILSCEEGYSGDECKFPVCYGVFGPDACSGHGLCTETDHCECSSGFLGATCALRIELIVSIAAVLSVLSVVALMLVVGIVVVVCVCRKKHGREASSGDFELETSSKG